jgi:Domain of unknown function (DUF1963)
MASASHCKKSDRQMADRTCTCSPAPTAALGGGIGGADPRLLAGQARWTLVAQIDTDDRAEMMWGDCGTLYWLFRRDEMTASRLDQRRSLAMRMPRQRPRPSRCRGRDRPAQITLFGRGGNPDSGHQTAAPNGGSGVLKADRTPARGRNC